MCHLISKVNRPRWPPMFDRFSIKCRILATRKPPEHLQVCPRMTTFFKILTTLHACTIGMINLQSIAFPFVSISGVLTVFSEHPINFKWKRGRVVELAHNQIPHDDWPEPEITWFLRGYCTAPWYVGWTSWPKKTTFIYIYIHVEHSYGFK